MAFFGRRECCCGGTLLGMKGWCWIRRAVGSSFECEAVWLRSDVRCSFRPTAGPAYTLRQ